MSQKKHKKTFRLSPDEVAIAGPRDQWEHLILVYTTMSEDAAPEDKHYWLESADWIRAALIEDELSNVYGEDFE